MGVVLLKKSLSIMLSVLVFAILAMPVSAFASHKYKRSCVTLYEHINFKGRLITFCSDDKTLVNKTNKHLKYGKKNWNDVASSVKVSGGEGVILYEHVNFKGHHWVLKPGAKIADFTKHKLGKATWNDVVSSVRIIK